MTTATAIQNTRQAFICYYNFHTNDDGKKVCNWLITTDEVEARETDQNYSLASISDLHDWICATGEVLTGTINTSNGLCTWFESESIDPITEEENYWCEYIPFNLFDVA